MIHPIGFLSDHMEVLYDLDEEAATSLRALGLNMVRSRTVGTHPRFVGMLRELIAERIGADFEPRSRRAVGDGPEPRCLSRDLLPVPVPGARRRPRPDVKIPERRT